MWFELFVVTLLFLLGHIFFGHFEERSPSWRKLAKYVVAAAIVVVVSQLFGRIAALTLLGLALLPVVYVHAVLLPRKGINGSTGEPKRRYYEFRGWDTDIFGDRAA
jgi:hypothetical protein